MAGETKECVACAEQIQANAKLCRFCNTLQNDQRFHPQSKSEAAPHSTSVAAVNSLIDSFEICPRCKKYVIEDVWAEICGVCLGTSRTGKVPGDPSLGSPSQSIEAANLPKGYNHVPLGPTPGIAIVAVVLAFITPILGLILGYAARTEVRNPHSPKEGDQLATIAIVVGWIWIIVGVIWVFITISAASRVSSYGYDTDMPVIGSVWMPGLASY